MIGDLYMFRARVGSRFPGLMAITGKGGFGRLEEFFIKGLNDNQ
jgi:hypothetical protein